MQTEVTFDIPNDIVGKLATGEYERVGGVVRNKATGEVVMWLREASVSPSSPEQLSSTFAKNFLSMAGSTASILNLGATIAFGVGTLQKLGRIESKLDVMDAKLDEINQKLDVVIAKLDELNQRVQKIQWTVDLGFAHTLQALENIKHHQEVQLAGDLNSAASMAWSCQFLEPNSPQRMTRIENAFHTASNVKEKLLLHAEQEMRKAIEWMQNKRLKNFDFNIDDSIITALYRLRQTIAACALSASISAEADDLYTAGNQLAKEQERLLALFQAFSGICLGSHEQVYQILLSKNYQEIMPATRLDMWANRFDPQLAGLSDVIELLRMKGFPKDIASTIKTTPVSPQRRVSANSKTNKAVSVNNTPLFFNLIDGLYEDLQRLCGYEMEYKSASSLGVSIHEYRELLRIDNIVDNKRLVFFTAKKQSSN